MNRWKALMDIVEILREVNRDSVKMVLEIYTKDQLTKKQNAILNDNINSYVKGAVSQEQLAEIYREADIASQI